MVLVRTFLPKVLIKDFKFLGQLSHTAELSTLELFLDRFKLLSNEILSFLNIFGGHLLLEFGKGLVDHGLELSEGLLPLVIVFGSFNKKLKQIALSLLFPF